MVLKFSSITFIKPEYEKPDTLFDFISGFTFIPNGFGHQSNDPAVCCKDRIIGDFELIYVAGGKSYITVSEKNYTCSAGEVILIPPFTRHSIITSSTHPHDHYWLHFDVLPVYKHGEFFAALTGNEGSQVGRGFESELAHLYMALENDINRERPGYRIILHTTLLHIVTILLRRRAELSSDCSYMPISDKKLGTEKKMIDSCVDYIYSSMDRNIKLADLCSHLHVGESCLFKAFAKVLGISPGNFIQTLKIKRAERLIKTTDLSFKEISDMLGFSSSYHFSNVFKKHYGMSPKTYRTNRFL